MKEFKGETDLSTLSLREFRDVMRDTFSNSEDISRATDLMSQTFTGMWSNLKDQLSSSLSTIFTPLMNAFKPIISNIANLIKSLEPMFQLIGIPLTGIVKLIDYLPLGIIAFVAALKGLSVLFQKV